ncbi:hypothetical protein FRC03_010426 [Tulasnella sp. 419]|nr:hypothetical protein FRC03_010426 [Tulasnella sp. 419]
MASATTESPSLFTSIGPLQLDLFGTDHSLQSLALPHTGFMTTPPIQGNAFPYFLQPPPPGTIDPALAVALYQAQQQQAAAQQQFAGLFPPPHHPTPASEASADSPDPSSSKSKRPATTKDGSGSRKKSKKDEEIDEDDDDRDEKESKPKSTRGSRACTVCRRLKMKCVGAEHGPPCKRCEAGKHECVFEESNRGKRSTKKSEALAERVRGLESQLGAIVKSIGKGAFDAILERTDSRSPSPSAEGNQRINPLSPSPSRQTPEMSASGSGTQVPARGTFRSSSSASQRNQPPSGSLGAHRQLSTPRPPSPTVQGLPDNALNPLGLLAEASLAKSQTMGSKQEEVLPRVSDPIETDPPQSVGLANASYFKPGPMTILPLRRLFIEKQIQPEMLTFVTPKEVIDLFKIYFDFMNPHCSLLDPNWHTPSFVCSRSPFLLTAICAVSSKFYSARSELHQKLNKIVKKLAFSVAEAGYKSTEVVQAYLLLTLWGIGPVERFEFDRTWILLGMAIRTATDLNLHRKSEYAAENTPEGKTRNLEIRNRERTWLLCYALDRSLSSQMGKPHTVKEDYIIRNAGSQWWRHPDALPFDVGLAAYVEIQRILSRGLDFLYSGVENPSALQQDCDYLMITKTLEAQLLSWANEWEFHRRDMSAQTEGIYDRNLEYRNLVSQFYLNYAFLVVNSFGLQNALERSQVDIPYFFGRCHSAASTVAKIVKDSLGPKGYLRYSPDSHFVFTSYAVLTLLKLIRPEFKPYMESEKATMDLVNEMADLLEDVAANPYHTPALYSSFLRALVTAKVESSHPTSPRISSHGSDIAMVDAHYKAPAEGTSSKPVSQAGSSHRGSSPHREMPLNMANEYLGEMGPMTVQDMSTFPPTMGPPTADANDMGMFNMDHFLANGFWDNVLIPGYSHSFDGLSGGFVYGPGGSGFITPKFATPVASGANSPHQPGMAPPLTPGSLNAAFGKV